MKAAVIYCEKIFILSRLKSWTYGTVKKSSEVVGILTPSLIRFYIISFNPRRPYFNLYWTVSTILTEGSRPGVGRHFKESHFVRQLVSAKRLNFTLLLNVSEHPCPL